MGRLIFSILLIGQIFLIYTRILDFTVKKSIVYRIGVLISIISALIIVELLGGFSQTRLAVIIGIMLPLLFSANYVTAYGLYFPIAGLCLSLNSLWSLFINNNSLIIYGKMEEFICLVITYLLIICIGYIKCKRKIEFGNLELSFSEIIIFNLYTLIIGISMCGAEIIQKGNGTQKVFEAYVTTTAFLCSVVYFMTLKSFFLNRKIQQDKEKYIYQKMTLDLQNEQIKAILDSEGKIKAFKHDFNAHINALYSLANKEDICGMKDYCGEILNHSYICDNTMISGNTAVDGILGHANNKCNETGIELELDVVLLKENKLSDYEMCIIFSNILNNAIEACKAGDKIKLVSYPYNEYLCIITRNPLHKSLKVLDGTIETTKKQRHLHGYGIRNIAAVVDRYDGKMKIETTNGIFNMEILI